MTGWSDWKLCDQQRASNFDPAGGGALLALYSMEVAPVSVDQGRSWRISRSAGGAELGVLGRFDWPCGARPKTFVAIESRFGVAKVALSADAGPNNLADDCEGLLRFRAIGIFDEKDDRCWAMLTESGAAATGA